MKLKIKSLTLAFFIFYFVYQPLRTLMDTGDFYKMIEDYTSLAGILGLISTLLYLFTYTAGAYWMFFKTYTKERQYLSFSLLLVVALAAIFLRYLLEEMIGPYFFGLRNYPPGTSISYYIFDNLYFAIIYMSLGTVFFFIQFAQHKEVQQRELVLQNQKTELAFLRSQINPHFLFNILNNIYSLIYYKSDNALKAVEKLSGLLRYALYEKADKVSFKKEIGYLNDFIDLQKMRLDYEPQYAFNIAGDILHLKVAPFLMIPFIENAFKHGNLKDPQQAMVIDIRKMDDEVQFTVENEKKSQEKDEMGGIGVQNVQKRLQLLYGEQSDLQIIETETTFKIKLKIALSAC